MKKNNGKYTEVEKLPLNACTVAEYAAKNNMSQSNVYKKIERKKADYKIIVFQTINFVVPA